MDVYAQVLVNGLAAGSAYALLALALSLNHETNGFTNFGLGALFTVSLYIFAAASAAFPSHVGIAVVVTLIAAAVGGGVLELAVQRPARRHNISMPAQMIGSLGLLIAVESAVGWIAGPHTRTIDLALSSEVLVAGPLRVPVLQIVTMCTVAVVALLAYVVLFRTPVGRRVRAVSADSLLATCFGIAVDRVILGATVVSAVLLAVAAILIGSETGMTPTMGFPILLIGLVTLLLGGIGSIAGAVSAGVAIGVLQHATAWFISGRWQDFFVYIVLLALLRFRPAGLRGVTTRTSRVPQ